MTPTEQRARRSRTCSNYRTISRPPTPPYSRSTSRIASPLLLTIAPPRSSLPFAGLIARGTSHSTIRRLVVHPPTISIAIGSTDAHSIDRCCTDDGRMRGSPRSRLNCGTSARACVRALLTCSGESTAFSFSFSSRCLRLHSVSRWSRWPSCSCASSASEWPQTPQRGRRQDRRRQTERTESVPSAPHRSSRARECSSRFYTMTQQSQAARSEQWPTNSRDVCSCRQLLCH